MNRIEPILNEINESFDQEDQMLMIMDALKDTVTPVPEPGTICIPIFISDSSITAFEASRIDCDNSLIDIIVPLVRSS